MSRALFSRETLHQGGGLDGGDTGDKKHNGDLHLSFSRFELSLSLGLLSVTLRFIESSVIRDPG